MNNKNLNAARMNKNDEFYTQLCDIENELQHYKDHFYDKIVYCNCDDPFKSNFFKYFVVHFNELHLQKLICTCYDGNPIDYTKKQLFDYRLICGNRSNRVAYKIEVTHIDNYVSESMSNLELFEHIDAIPERLKGNGDFRSPECIEFLKQCNIVVGNPPFSLFREFISYMIDYSKKFLVLGSINAVSYKDVFQLIKKNEVWIGASIHSGDREFQVPNDYPLEASGFRIDESGNKFISVKGVRWFTNLDYANRHVSLKLTKSYQDSLYQRFDNYDAINVNDTCDIPLDYNGVMGVPITFLDKYSPEQFEILGITDRQNTSGLRTKKYTAKDSENYNDLNCRGTLYIGGVYQPVYPRILIRRKQ